MKTWFVVIKKYEIETYVANLFFLINIKFNIVHLFICFIIHWHYL